MMGFSSFRFPITLNELIRVSGAQYHAELHEVPSTVMSTSRLHGTALHH